MSVHILSSVSLSCGRHRVQRGSARGLGLTQDEGDEGMPTEIVAPPWRKEVRVELRGSGSRR